MAKTLCIATLFCFVLVASTNGLFNGDALRKSIARNKAAGLYHTIGFPGEADAVVLDKSGTIHAQFVFPNLNPVEPDFGLGLNFAPGTWDVLEADEGCDPVIEFTFFELMRDPGNVTFVNGECDPACFIAVYGKGPVDLDAGSVTFDEYLSFRDLNLNPITSEDLTLPGEDYLVGSRTLYKITTEQVKDLIRDQGAPIP